jgi:hypothetical protein
VAMERRPAREYQTQLVVSLIIIHYTVRLRGAGGEHVALYSRVDGGPWATTSQAPS